MLKLRHIETAVNSRGCIMVINPRSAADASAANLGQYHQWTNQKARQSLTSGLSFSIPAESNLHTRPPRACRDRPFARGRACAAHVDHT